MSDRRLYPSAPNPRASTNHAELYHATADGKKLACGTVTLDGSNPTAVVTGLSAIDSATVTPVGATTPGDDPVHFTIAVSGGTLNIYAWGHDGTDPTLVASTDSSTVLHWMAVGDL